MTPHFEIFMEDGDWHWKLVDETGRTLCRSAEGHNAQHGAAHDIERVKQIAKMAHVEEGF